MQGEFEDLTEGKQLKKWAFIPENFKEDVAITFKRPEVLTFPGLFFSPSRG